MRKRRFFLFWLLYYVLAFGFMLEMTILLASTDRNLRIALGLAVGLLLTVFFSWIAARREKKETAHPLRFAAVWVLLSIIADALIIWRLYGLNPFSLLVDALGVLIYGITFFGALIGFSIALRRVAASGTPSPRSELASQLSSAQRPQERE